MVQGGIDCVNAQRIDKGVGVIPAEILGFVVLAIVEVHFIRNAVSLHALPKTLLDCGSVWVRVTDQRRNNLIGSCIEEYGKPEPDGVSFLITHKDVKKVVIGKLNVI